ncbi:GIY-YIG catalytic domain protein [Actinomyces urogenitalis DSM 15434]|uniref:GIY-YIG catalytic domain protein n=2 Tax=Actinomyces urogenitalis TaxID=103621 RepID=C0W351_9ACTO|nr:DEDD exonuclease domain-containing protein [Actinomyces urogenitalis]EEH66863.1 GIY-YIG catalytic domain protein [Actinomyces urogenitalis DSM 15434]MDK8835964.1 DEDD exonuclease domain-containing protein [Actinomyces urogenitalis]
MVASEIPSSAFAGATQASFESMGTPLQETTFVVVDLETTGAGPGSHTITEIGAVRVRGGQVEDELSTLVNPGRAIPAQITVLTGITNAMVAGAPPVPEALERFLQWARLWEEETVLVAHNARFDVGHLRGAARALELDWHEPRVLDTLALARRAWTRSEVPNHRLATLASFVGSPTRPTHRALDDARATVDVLHAALEVLGPLGVTHLEDLATATDPVPARRRAKSRLAQDLPTSPGVYQFLSAAGQVLYVGSAVDLRRRVRSYFTAAEKRTRVTQMLDTTVQVRAIPTPTEVEARVRELRLIAELDPPVNRRSRSPRRQPWLHLVRGSHPHLAGTTVLPTSEVGSAVGPFSSRHSLSQAQRAVECALGLRAWHDQAARSQEILQALAEQIDLVAVPALEQVARLSAAERYEEAGLWTTRLRSLLAAARRADQVRPLLSCPHLIAARRRSGGSWELVCVRWGRLAGSAVTPPGADPRPMVASLRATAQVVSRPERVGQDTSVEETLVLADWVLDDGARLVEVEGPTEVLTWPVGSAARYRKVLASRD